MNVIFKKMACVLFWCLGTFLCVAMEEQKTVAAQKQWRCTAMASRPASANRSQDIAGETAPIL